MNEKKDPLKGSEAAPEGPPHDLVHGRGQKPAEAPKGNLSMSHNEECNTFASSNQARYRTDLTDQALLTENLSNERLQRYSTAAVHSGVAREDIYLWNCDLSEAFHFSMHIAEITCRNSIHSALLFKGDRWFEDPMFYKILGPHRSKDLDIAIQDETERHGDAMDANHLVSSLSFGFWEDLTTKRFARYLFPKGFQKNFKHAPWDAKLDDLHTLIESVRRWRNRIAHHNALFDKKPSSKYQDALKLISWSSPKMEAWVSARSRVNQIINMRPRGE